MAVIMKRAWPLSFVPLLLFSLILSINHVEVQASNELNDSPSIHKSNLTAPSSFPTSSQTVAHTLDHLKIKSTLASSHAHTAKTAEAAKPAPAASTNGTGTEPVLKPYGSCGNIAKRSWTNRIRTAAHLHVRGGCAVPITLQPVGGLVPVNTSPNKSNVPGVLEPAGALQPAPQSDLAPQPATTPKSTSSPQPASSPDTQVTKDTQQTNTSPEDSSQADTTQADTSDTSQADTSDTSEADTSQVDTSQTDTQTDTQSGQGASEADSESATPDVAAVPTDSPITVQGQTVPTNGDTITVNNQPVKISSGNIYVGTSSAPIPEALVTQAHAIVAGSLTFQPASPSSVAQVAPSPVVVGGLTFSQPAPSSDTPSDQSQAQPVVIGGKMYTPIAPTSQSAGSQTAGNAPDEGTSKPSGSQGQSNNEADNDDSSSSQPNGQAAQADSKPIEIGGLTYWPITAIATPTPSLEHAAVFSFDGKAFTQGGEAVTISGTRYSLGPSGALMGTSVLPFITPAPTASLLAVGSQTLTALSDSEGGFEVDNFKLLPGSSGTTISGTLYSVNKGDFLIVGISTIPLATAGGGNTSNSALTAGGETFTPLGSTAAEVDGTTFSIGGPPITENGTTISLASNGFVVGSSTFAYATPAPNTATASTASGTITTGVLPSGGATLSTFPSATGGVGTSAASANILAPKVMMAVFGISISLSLIIGIL